MTNTQRGMFIAFGCAMVFGLYPAGVHMVYASGGNPSFVMLVTTWARAIPLLGYCWVRRLPMFKAPQSRQIVLGGGALQMGSLFGVFAALQYLPGPVVLIILFTHTLMLLLFMAWRGEIKLDTTTLFSTVAALFGLTMVLDVWHVQAPGNLIGMALAFLAAIATLTRLYAFGKQTKLRTPAIVGAETFFGAALYVSIIALFQTPHAPVGGIAYAYLTLACASLSIGTFGMFYGISLLGSFRWSLYLKLEPVFTALFSFLILGELLKPMQYVGMGIVLASLAAYQIAAHRKASQAVLEGPAAG